MLRQARSERRTATIRTSRTAVSSEKIATAGGIGYAHTDAGQQIFRFAGSGWTAQLRCLAWNANQATYRFEFTNWHTHNGMLQKLRTKQSIF